MGLVLQYSPRLKESSPATLRAHPEEAAVRMFRWLYRNYEMAAYGFVVVMTLALAALAPTLSR
ncbi:hypothetical protein GCM10010274_49490 [Streptomyces lavendofoliae]|uniref:Uncharacterized protein n=1 Tax=Streptomyces lavendofoliae TaxID=67314 RepID=A0A918I390_9ACTN|nr:hypothetical protein GCM10010274_49490 [Streptomyces lavendofoliae]